MDKEINVILMSKGYGKATKEVRDYISNLQQRVEQLENIIKDFENWLEEKGNIDYDGSVRTLHEQVALSIAHDYLELLLEDNLNKGSEES